METWIVMSDGFPHSHWDALELACGQARVLKNAGRPNVIVGRWIFEEVVGEEDKLFGGKYSPQSGKIFRGNRKPYEETSRENEKWLSTGEIMKFNNPSLINYVRIADGDHIDLGLLGSDDFDKWIEQYSNALRKHWLARKKRLSENNKK